MLPFLFKDFLFFSDRVESRDNSCIIEKHQIDRSHTCIYLVKSQRSNKCSEIDHAPSLFDWVIGDPYLNLPEYRVWIKNPVTCLNQIIVSSALLSDINPQLRWLQENMPLENLADVFSNLFNFQCLILGLTDLTPHPRAPKLNTANFLTQDYSHILHVVLWLVFAVHTLTET